MFRQLLLAVVCLHFLNPLVRSTEPQVAEAEADADAAIRVAPGDWPWWRGPNRNGVAKSGQQIPLQWSDTKNVIWKTPIPGRGHSSPTVVADRIYLATADETNQVQSVLCLDRTSGRQIWKKDIHQGGFSKKANKRSSFASSTVACDGKRLFINFNNHGAVFTTALNLDGDILWQKKITDYVVHQGYGSSPALYKSVVLVSADNKGGGAIAGLDRQSGKFVWKHQRPEQPNYASPIVLHVAGRDQLLFTGCDLVSSFDPTTGKKLWETEGATTETVTSTVTDGQSIITSGGYPDNHISAVRADGSGKTLWRNKTRVYVPSMIERDGYLYVVNDSGVGYCLDFKTGDEAWKVRLGGTFNASLVLLDDRLFATNQDGTTFIYKATPKSFQLLAKNELGNDVFATPTICGNRLYMRVATGSRRDRQEWLYCIGAKQKIQKN